MPYKKEYIIPINPVAWKRAGLRNGGKFYDEQKHEKLACGLYLNQQHGDDPLFTKALQVEIIFYVALPKLIKDRKKSQWCSTYPDIDNFCKFCFDVITDTGVIWNDDRLISVLHARKLYDSEPRTHIIITELE